jgi:hypothetical protein
MRVDSFVDVLNSASRADLNKILDVIMTVTFDGTQTPIAAITANTDPGTAVFYYHLNLTTGQIVRSP